MCFLCDQPTAFEPAGMQRRRSSSDSVFGPGWKCSLRALAEVLSQLYTSVHSMFVNAKEENSDSVISANCSGLRECFFGEPGKIEPGTLPLLVNHGQQKALGLPNKLDTWTVRMILDLWILN